MSERHIVPGTDKSFSSKDMVVISNSARLEDKGYSSLSTNAGVGRVLRILDYSGWAGGVGERFRITGV